MAKRTLLGMLTPSSNTILEPVTATMLSGVPGITAHFSRFRVTEISLAEAALRQFDLAPFVEAARLLADAHVDVIAWNGTSAGWMGIDRDRALCARIGEELNTPATTSTLALLDAFSRAGVRRYGLVTPYIGAVQDRILENFAAEGFACAAEERLEQKDNFSFSEVTEEQMRQMARSAARAEPDAIAIYCTNMNGARLAAELEDELGIPVLDSVSVTVWQSLLLANREPSALAGWGRLFTDTVFTEGTVHHA